MAETEKHSTVTEADYILSEEQHPQENEGVFLPEPFHDIFVEKGLSLNERMVANGVTNATVIKERVTGNDERRHTLLEVDIDGFSHRFWYTDADVKTDLTIVMKPGFGELIEDGVGWGFHYNVARRLPHANVVSYATHGVGPTAKALSKDEMESYGLDEMAKQGVELLDSFFHEDRLIYIGTSMGSVIGNKLLRHNSAQGQPCNFEGVIYYASALVDPKNVPIDMALKFPGQVIVDVGKEIVLKTKPWRWIGYGAMLLASRPSRDDLKPMRHLAKDLLKGTPRAEVEEVVSEYPVWVVSGENDSLFQKQMWLELQEDYPGLTIVPLRGRGHGIAVKPVEGSRKLSKIIKASGIYPNSSDVQQEHAA